jgi:glycosyltransferase involved in cell wall biosynthesis
MLGASPSTPGRFASFVAYAIIVSDRSHGCWRVGIILDESDGSQEARPLLITIGMPTYNSADFVEQALAALMRQTYRNFLVQVSDDASTDRTWDLLQRWVAGDPRFILHRQPKNLGLIGNFRYVLDQATSEFFMWHAHDDWIAPNFLEALVAVMATEPDCALACARIVKVLPDGRPVKCRDFPDFSGMSRRSRITTMLRHPRSPWLYGLHRTQAVRRAFTLMEEFGYAWGGDFLVLLPLILEDRVRGTNRTNFYSRMTGISSVVHRPHRLVGQVRFAGRYLRFNARLFWTSGLSLSERLMFSPLLALHAGRVSLDSGPLRKLLGRSRPRYP